MAMEQFDKWWEKNKSYLECIDSPVNYDARTTARVVWRTALEWVLNNYPDDAIYEIIKKELGNGNK